ncbi:MAG: hypothetical protein OSB34_05485, partial [Planktomarina sp.]|nr:hypothetical protein [Planktomarina sp.]
AQRVTECAADCYTALTGKAPAFEVSTRNSAESGRWIGFLEKTFEVLNIDELPESQAQIWMEKNRN